MPPSSALYATILRQELTARNRLYARARAHVESYGSNPVIVYAPDDECHGNFFDPAYASITARPEWMRRFDKVHAVFCSPGVANSTAVKKFLGVEDISIPIFGWKARVPLSNGRFDRTEVDLRFGNLLIEAKLTESDFQTCEEQVVEAYRDFESVFNPELLQKIEMSPKRRKTASEFPEAYSQEFESLIDLLNPQTRPAIPANSLASLETGKAGYASYQLIRNVLAAHASDCSFCVLHDERRPDLREQWFQVMAAVRDAELRVRMKVLTWQELTAHLPDDLQEFLDHKYGIVAPGKTASPLEET